MSTTGTLDLGDLATGPSQQWGNIRLVPLLRPEPVPGLRLHDQVNESPVTVAGSGRRSVYVGYVPHAYVATWGDDPEPSAAHGTQLLDADARAPRERVRLAFQHRRVQRLGRNRSRFLPLHLAVDGLLSLGFGGPPIAWAEWADKTVRDGLSPREETVYRGEHVSDLQEALRVFEIHPDQCGVVVHVADALAAVHVVPHPEDYRVLHPTLLLDMFGEQLFVYGLLHFTVRALHEPIDPGSVRDLADLRRAVEASRAASATGHDELMLPSLTGADHAFEWLYERSGFTLGRFLPSFRGDRDNHIGEVITAADGRVAYLKTLRLSNAQVRRGRLLRALEEADWSLEGAARALGTDRSGLITRIERAGLAHLLNRALLERHRAARARRVGRYTP
ncbi:hypothetical protein [Nocardiopsis sp. FIRDI 009]|uniref:ARPP-2 domain-containing protein n=1 Tax=Nocardiopsis sp. FIRDI 009 TaxID=714197 RepID=UPI0013002C3A|nr:hypothetical protein [Nocardiopsis sp. FIRDI 009]